MNYAQAINFFINNDHLTADLPTDQRSRLINFIEVEKLEQDQIIYTPRDNARFFYFLAEGQVSMTKDVTGTDNLHDLTLLPGEYFGLESGTSSQHYSNTAISLSKTTVIKIPRFRLHQIFEADPGAAQRFLSQLLTRFTDLRVSSETLVKKEQGTFFVNLTLKNVLGWLLSLVLPTTIYFFLQKANVTSEMQIFLCSISAAFCMWSFYLLPRFVPAILLITVFYTTSIAPPRTILNGFAGEPFLIALSVYSLSSAIKISGIAYRILLLILKYIPSTPFWVNFSLFIFGFFLSTAVPDTRSRNQIMAPYLLDMAAFTHNKSDGHARTTLVFAGIAGTSLFSAIFFNGSMHNLMLAGFFWGQDQERFQWSGWLEAAAVTGCIFFIAHLVLLFIMSRQLPPLSLDRQRIHHQHKTLGKMKAAEFSTLVAFLFIICGFATLNLHRIPAASIGLLTVFILVCFGPLTRKAFQEQIDWPNILIIACLISTLSIYSTLGAPSLLVQKLSWIGRIIKKDFTLFMSCWAAVVVLARFILPEGPVVLISSCILAAVALKAEINIWLVCFISLILGKMWFLPYQSPAFTRIKERIGNEINFNEKKLLLLNFLSNVLILLSLVLSVPYWEKIGLI